MPFPKFQIPPSANPANLLNKREESRPARESEDSQDLLISAKPANPLAKVANPEANPSEKGEFSNPISRISKGLAKPTSGDSLPPGQEKPEEFSRLATLASSHVQQPTLLETRGAPSKEAKSLAGKAVELGAPTLRLYVDRTPREYRSIAGMSREEVAWAAHQLIEEAEGKAHESIVEIVAEWPGEWPIIARSEVLWAVVDL